jgi:TRAP-type mannitol/chloroaromatic compound transport system permease large subunit
MLSMIFVLGMFVEPAGIIMLVGPLFAQIAKGLGIDLIWFGVLFVIMLQIGYLTPPFGISLFFMKAVCPPQIRTIDIYRSIIPFIAIMIVTVILILIFPGIATWLPSVLVK